MQVVIDPLSDVLQFKGQAIRKGTIDGESTHRLELEPAESIPVQTQIPSELPPDLQYLDDCEKYGIPVNVVMAHDSALLPFALGEGVQVVYLGFFKIMASNVSIPL